MKTQTEPITTRYPLCAHQGCPAAAAERHVDPQHGDYGYCRPCEMWQRTPHFSDCKHGAGQGSGDGR